MRSMRQCLASGRIIKFKRDDALNAIAQLRDMLGLKAPTKIPPTTPDGAALTLEAVVAASFLPKRVSDTQPPGPEEKP